MTPSESGQGAPPPGADDELYERLAAIEHERWASWQRYLHSKCTVQIATDRDPGALVIPSGYVANLWRLIDTPYADLTEAEKASDREQVDRYWHLVGPVDESSSEAADGVRVQATEYVVSALPEDDGNRGWRYGPHWNLRVAYRGRGQWAVVDSPDCLSRSGEWVYEQRPSERSDEWIAEHRFDLTTALRLAREHAPLMTVNGFTVADVRARIKEARDA